MPRLRPTIYCLVSAALFGASTPASKALLGAIDPVALAALLYLGAAFAVAPMALAGTSRAALRDARSSLRPLLGAVLFGGVLGPALLMLGLRVSASMNASLWLNFETVFTALLAAAFFREHVGQRALVSSALVVATGATLAFIEPVTSGGISGAAFIAGACLCWALDNNWTAIIDGLTPAQVTFVKGAVAGTVNLAIAHVLGDLPLPAWPITLGALAVGGVGYGLSIQLYIRGAQQLGALRSQLLFSTAPFFGLAFAWVFLGETLSAPTALAALVIAGSLVLLFSETHAHLHTHERLEHIHEHAHDDGHHTHTHPGLTPSTRHTHLHSHDTVTHTHAHEPDLHHRHTH